MRQLACGSQLQPWKHFPNHQKPFKRFSTARAPAFLHLYLCVCACVHVCVSVSARYTLCWYINDDFSFFVRVDWIAWFNTLRCVSAYTSTPSSAHRAVAVVIVPVAASTTLTAAVSLTASPARHLHLFIGTYHVQLLSLFLGGVNFVIQLTRPLRKLTIIFYFIIICSHTSAQVYCMFTQLQQTIGRRKPKETSAKFLILAIELWKWRGVNRS